MRRIITAGLSAPNTMQNPGQNTYRSAVGYLATSIDALKLIMTSVLSTKPWLRDPEVVTIPWRQEIADNTLARARTNGAANDKLPLKLGVFWTDNVVAPQPPITRGLHTVVDTLRAAGHIVVDWNPPSQDTAKRVHVRTFQSVGIDIWGLAHALCLLACLLEGRWRSSYSPAVGCLW